MAKDLSWLDDEEETKATVVDAHGATLLDGDTIMSIKDIKVK
jgi:uncharacterized Zn ribbon protein